MCTCMYNKRFIYLFIDIIIVTYKILAHQIKYMGELNAYGILFQ